MNQWTSSLSLISISIKMSSSSRLNQDLSLFFTITASAMDCRWYRFDFEYRIPHGLPTSFKESDGKLMYYACGSVTQPDGPDIETFDTQFHVKGFVDIDTLPPTLHNPVERRNEKVYQRVINGSQMLAVADEEHASCDASMGDDFQASATLCLNSQAFTVGQHIIADVVVENCTNGILLCTLKMEQVSR